MITGASSGIGAAFATVLSEPTLLLTGRNAERLRRTAAQRPDGAAPVACVDADLATDAGRARVIERAKEIGIDLLVCNAGESWSGNFLDIPFAAARDTVTINIVATMELLHALLPDMVKHARRENRRAGVIILSSMGAFGPAPGFACYAASKMFVLRLAQALAVELAGEPIDVLALCPTYTATDFFARAGLPPPERAMAAEAVAREAMAALGRETVHLCSMHRYPQAIRRLVAFNPEFAVWRWPRRIAEWLHAGAAHGSSSPPRVLSEEG